MNQNPDWGFEIYLFWRFSFKRIGVKLIPMPEVIFLLCEHNARFTVLAFNHGFDIKLFSLLFSYFASKRVPIKVKFKSRFRTWLQFWQLIGFDPADYAVLAKISRHSYIRQGHCQNCTFKCKNEGFIRFSNSWTSDCKNYLGLFLSQFERTESLKLEFEAID